MSVRKIYQVVVDGKVVFTGSYNMCLACYESLMCSFDFLYPDNGDTKPVVVLAFRPDIKSNSDGGLFV